MKILLVEDNAFVKAVVAGQLEQEQYQVVAVNNVADALKALAEEEFSLLITDIVLPGADGGQLMKQVRQQSPEMPILAITGGVENAAEDYAHYADLFADKTLVKPIKKDDLLSTVAALIGAG